ncbi:MAG: PAS domain S-box protein [Ignavibacteriales bacterium]|nr:PAS domain S-box protein [Ignavibacteriales bacterium]
MDALSSNADNNNQEKSEQNIKQQLSVLKGIIESIKSPVFSVDKEFKYTSFNKEHAIIMKLLYNAKIELNNNMLDYMTVGKDHEKAKLNLSKALKGENIIEEAFSGEELLSRLYFEVTHNPIYDHDNKIIGVAVMAKDITIRKKAEVKLQTSEKCYRRLFESAKDGILILDTLTGKIVDVNPFIKKMLGYSHEELIDKELWEIGAFKNISASKEAFIELQSKEYIRFENMPLETKEGKLINVEFISNVYLVDDKKVIQCNIRDITERIIANEQLLIAKVKAEESDRLKTAFLHNVSHEIRTPLNAIVGFSGFLNNPDLSAEKRKNFTDIILQSSDQLLSIIDDIIRIASIESGQEIIQENEININLICNLLKEQFLPQSINKNITFNLKTILPDDEAIIITDSTKIIQILTNLIVNALKFTQQGYITFGYMVKDSHLEFYVEDSGIGIPLNMQDEIFKRFRQVETTDTRNFGGSGLGLSISKAYVEMLGGKMRLTSELNKGSVFYFTIPYKKVNLKKLPDIPNIKGLHFEFKKPKTLLIAEDEDSNFMLLQELLSDMGISIIRAVNGIEAVELCKSNPQINLVLMDIKMPEMDGYEATMQIKEFKPDLYIIAQTAYSTEADKNKAFACGCSDFMSKPLKRDLLLSKINEQLLK